ncbi:recombinase family protein [Kitasatospora atroaurantiaca]|uniref:recombinase family protein n=1 Tax=Kitasatospora atroaurantiaca TaxID=285545 RepID=UPI0011A159BC|nr:recombinase family protein [Kitasatospora atroaurantiaca]
MYGFADAARTRLVEQEAAVLRVAASRRLAEQPYPAITDWMAAEGHLTTMGKLWRPARLAEILANPAVAGLVREDDGTLVETGGLGAITREVFEDLERLNASKRPAEGRSDDRDYLLTGELSADSVCGLCGMPIGASPSNSGARGYRCMPSTRQHPGGCGKVRLNADLGEAYVAEHVLAELMKPEVRAVVESARESIEAEAKPLRRRLAENKKARRLLSTRYGQSEQVARRTAPDAEGPVAQVEAANNELLRQLRAAEQELDAQIRRDSSRLTFIEQLALLPRAEVPDLIRWWGHAPLRSQKALVGAMLERVALYPAGRGSRTVDGDRVALRWRQWDQEAARRAE